MAKKSKKITFTQEELTSLQELQQGYENIRGGFGELEVSRITLEKRLEQIDNEKLRLETEYSKLQLSEQELVARLTEKYGQGNLNPTTGEFTPTI